MDESQIFVLAASAILLLGCASPISESGISGALPKNATGPLKQAESLVNKSSLPSILPLARPQQSSSAQAGGASAPNSSAILPNAGPALLSSANNSSTPVTLPSQQSAEQLGTQISISNPSLPQVYFYYSTYCPYSIRILPFVQQAEADFANTTEWHSFNVFTRQGYYFFDKMAQERNFTNASRVVPVIIIGATPESGKMLTGIYEINSTLVPLLDEARTRPG